METNVQFALSKANAYCAVAQKLTWTAQNDRAPIAANLSDSAFLQKPIYSARP
jgi:hypothetical protein